MLMIVILLFFWCLVPIQLEIYCYDTLSAVTC